MTITKHSDADGEHDGADIKKRKTQTSHDNYQVFERKRVKMLVSLFPSGMNDFRNSIASSLNEKLLRYVPGLDGIFLAYENIENSSSAKSKSIHSGAMILNEQPQIHYEVNVDALVFTPRVGCRLRGVIKEECYPSHLGMLVLGFFNAIISTDHLEAAGYSFDRTLQQWDCGDKSLAYDETVEFTVVKLHECDGVISLEGSEPSIST